MSEGTKPGHALPFTGERFVPEKEGNIQLEHYHRYQMALDLVENKDVLDIASGEGFGSEILSSKAKSVTGADIDEASVAHANERYGHETLSFVVGDAAKIPLADNSFDVVVSFETIEHHNRHNEMMSEIRRVLRPGGTLVISSPEKRVYSDIPGTQNPYHVKELYRDEFSDLLSAYFKHVAIYGQRMAWGSIILSETEAVHSSSRYSDDPTPHAGLPDPIYLIAVASNEELTHLPAGGLLEQDILKSDPVTVFTHKLLAETRATETNRAQEMLMRIRKSKWFKLGKPFHRIKIPKLTHLDASSASQAKASEINLLFPIGHFYSPIADPKDISNRADDIFKPRTECVGVDFRVDEQLNLLRALEPYLADIDYPLDKPENDEVTYFYNNDQFPVLDAEFLFAALQHFKPKKIIEVGSGFSSLITADVNRRLVGNSMNFTCVEPYPRQFLIDGVDGISHLEISKVEDLPLAFFDQLSDNDILFIDSSHVSKIGSDVNYLFFEIIPRLKPGVIVHVHDIFLPDEYPKDWMLEQNRNWNEQYLLRSFLQFNSEWSVLWSAHLMGTLHRAEVQKVFPRYPSLGGAGSFWMRRLAKT